MKIIKYTNSFFIIILMISVGSKLIYQGGWIDTLLILFFIGCFQVLLGFILFLNRPNSIRFQLYVGGLLLFLFTCFLPFRNSWMILPIPLLLYFTFMIHTVHQKKNQYTSLKTS